jgi:hypothetical protein
MTKTEKFLKTVLFHKDIIKDKVLYLRRHYLSPRFDWLPRLFLHLIAKTDDDRFPHCHPTFFITLVLWGGYLEEVYQNEAQLRGEEPPLIRFVKPWTIGFRRATFIHKIIYLPKSRAWTLVFFGPNYRKWGFWDKDTFIPEAEYKAREDSVDNGD